MLISATFSTQRELWPLWRSHSTRTHIRFVIFSRRREEGNLKRGKIVCNFVRHYYLLSPTSFRWFWFPSALLLILSITVDCAWFSCNFYSTEIALSYYERSRSFEMQSELEQLHYWPRFGSHLHLLQTIQFRRRAKLDHFLSNIVDTHTFLHNITICCMDYVIRF